MMSSCSDGREYSSSTNLITVVYDKQTASSQMLAPTSHSMAQTFSQRTKRGRYRSGRHNIPRLNTVLLVLSFFLAGLAIALGSLPRRYTVQFRSIRRSRVTPIFFYYGNNFFSNYGISFGF
jgi:hypothetical protein